MPRSCAYCGQPKCNCKYRAGRRGESSITCSNISAQTNLGEMLKQLTKFAEIDPEQPTVWHFSYTRLRKIEP